MKRWQLLYSFIITICILLFSLNVIWLAIRDLFNGYDVFATLLPLTAVIGLVIAAFFYSNHVRKIRFSIKNLYFLNNVISFKAAMLALIVPSILFIVAGIYFLVTEIKSGTLTLPYAYAAFFVSISIYIWILIKLLLYIFKYTDLDTEDPEISEPFYIEEELPKRYRPLLEVPFAVLSHRQFAIASILELPETSYKTILPELKSKQFDNKGNFKLNYSNGKELNFTLLVTDNKMVHIRQNNPSLKNRKKFKKVIAKGIALSLKKYYQ